MTEREKIRELRQYISLETSLMNLKEHYEEMYTVVVKITPTPNEIGGGFSHGSSNDKLERNCIKLVEIEKKISSISQRLKRMDYALSELPYYHRKLVRLIDIQGTSVYRASKMLKRSYNAVKKSHDIAIQEVNL